MSNYIIGKCDMCGIDMIVGTPIEDKIVCHNCYVNYEKDKISFLQELSNNQKQQISDLQSQLAEKETEIEFLEGTINSMQEDISYWEQQLAEKDKEIANLKGLVGERDKQIKNLKTNKKRVIEHKNKTKISFALEWLEKVRNNLKKVPITDYDFGGNFEKMYKQDAIRQIDNQIKELKGEK